MSVSQSLGGTWELRQAGHDHEALKATVPGCVHLDLAEAGRIGDPFYGDNEYTNAWVHETDWEYSRTFTVDDALWDCDKVYLECDGLDTIARITLNGKPVAETDNMYIAYRFDVKGILQRGENRISVYFQSPSEYAKPFLAKDPVRSPGDSVPGSPYVRKCPSQWGWDWGPQIPTSGIWRPIRLTGYMGARIDDVWVRQKHDPEGKVTLDLEVTLEKYDDRACEVVVTLTHPDGEVQTARAGAGASKVALAIQVANPRLWWTNDLGGQPLYTVETSVECGGSTVHSRTQKVGLRTIELKQEKDEFGLSFTFEVNGVPIFAKGANWIPADQFPSRLDESRYRYLVSSAAKANMNMLRAWGGGFYEDEAFFDLCDEYGILVWQDFMFACALYPAHKEFLENVAREARHIVTKQRSRTCLALWCGNNEIESFLEEWWVDERVVERRAQYMAIFEELLRPTVAELDPDRSYWRSSPISDDEPFRNCQSELSGDAHNWGVWHGAKPFPSYREQKHRFTSEFGMQSFPCYETCATFAPKSHLNPTSYIMECHQKNGTGNSIILRYLIDTFRFPNSFRMTCYASQLLQAEAMRYGVEHWRRHRGQCMGAIYWQFNDIWPGASWAGIDFYGRWKALHYAARRFYDPILLSVCESGTSADIHLTNDTLEPAKVELKWTLEKLDGTVLREGSVETMVDGGTDKLLAALDFAGDLTPALSREAVLVTETTINDRNPAFTMTPFVPTKRLELEHTPISVLSGHNEDGAFLEVSSDSAARFVCIEIPGRDVVFSDNYFDLPAGRTVVVKVESEVAPAELASARAYSLVDSYWEEDAQRAPVVPEQKPAATGSTVTRMSPDAADIRRT